MEKVRINELVSQLQFFRTTGRTLPTLEACVNEGKMDYELMMARILVDPSLIEELNVNYDGQTMHLNYEVPEPMHHDLQKGNYDAMAIIACGLNQNKFRRVCDCLEDNQLRNFLWKYYRNYRRARA